MNHDDVTDVLISSCYKLVGAPGAVNHRDKDESVHGAISVSAEGGPIETSYQANPTPEVLRR